MSDNPLKNLPETKPRSNIAKTWDTIWETIGVKDPSFRDFLIEQKNLGENAPFHPSEAAAHKAMEGLEQYADMTHGYNPQEGIKKYLQSEVPEESIAAVLENPESLQYFIGPGTPKAVAPDAQKKAMNVAQELLDAQRKGEIDLARFPSVNAAANFDKDKQLSQEELASLVLGETAYKWDVGDGSRCRTSGVAMKNRVVAEDEFLITDGDKTALGSVVNYFNHCRVAANCINARKMLAYLSNRENIRLKYLSFPI